ncbi:tRNA 2-thiouridine(34) synthase MnmA, partial [Microgenomates group bacterium]|nr:tRNA 2-thiouridine(34) synthase MnmA [Microgenomates group bacterium]
MKAAVGLSGGVDSALAAALLKEQGFAVTGVFIECWNEPGCGTDEDRKDALGVALKLKIPFKVLDFKKEYKQKVLDWFYREYKKGRTPNPDIVCNQ